MRSKSKTSVEILEERDALHARVAELEATVAKIREEIEHALRQPEMSSSTLCRIDSVVRQVSPRPLDARDSESETLGPPISRVQATTTTSDGREPRRVG